MQSRRPCPFISECITHRMFAILFQWRHFGFCSVFFRAHKILRLKGFVMISFSILNGRCFACIYTLLSCFLFWNKVQSCVFLCWLVLILMTMLTNTIYEVVKHLRREKKIAFPWNGCQNSKRDIGIGMNGVLLFFHIIFVEFCWETKLLFSIIFHSSLWTKDL